MIDAGVVGRDGDDLIVRVALVDHLHDAHDLGLHEAEGLYGQGGDHEDVEGIFVVAIGLGDETVVDRIVEGGVDDAVEFEQTAVLIDLIFATRALWYFDDRVDVTRSVLAVWYAVPGM